MFATETDAIKEKERFEDARERIINRFASTEEFFKFAVSKEGLVLSQNVVTTIRENWKDNVHQQKVEALHTWKSYQRDSATSAHELQKIVDGYFQHHIQADAVSENKAQSMFTTPLSTPEDAQPGQGNPGNSIFNITNILGPVATLVSGAEKVIAGGERANLIDPDLPRLRPSGFGIETTGSTIQIGGASLSVPAHAVSDSQKVDLSYTIDTSDPPTGFVPVSSFLSCEPELVIRKRNMEVMIPLFCSTDKSVTVSLYNKTDEGQWHFLKDEVLDDEKKMYLSVGRFTNAAAFVSKDRIDDVMFSMTCMLFNNPDGKFAMGLCLNDEAIKNLFCHRMEKRDFVEIQLDDNVFDVSIGDVIKYYITPGQVMQNTKMTVDESFVCGFQGRVSECTVGADTVNPVYYVTQVRNGLILKEFSYDIPRYDSSNPQLGERGQVNIEIGENAEVNNMIEDASVVNIDQRKYVDGFGNNLQNDCVAYKENKEKVHTAVPRSTSVNSRRGSGTSRIRICGNAKIGNIVSGANRVNIDQRKVKGKRPGFKPQHKIERIVDAQEENGGEGAVAEKTPSPIAEEKTMVETSTVSQGSQPQAEAVPIWKDCEKEKERKQGDGSCQTQETERSCHSEISQKDNTSGPIYDDSNRRQSSDDEVDANSSEAVEEVNLETGVKKLKKTARHSQVVAEQPDESGSGVARDEQPNRQSRQSAESSNEVQQTEQSKLSERGMKDNKAGPIYGKEDENSSFDESDETRASGGSITTVPEVDAQSGKRKMKRAAKSCQKNDNKTEDSTISSLDTRHFIMFGIIVLLLAYIYTTDPKR